MKKRIDVRYCRSLERPFLRTRLNYLTAKRSSQSLSLTSSCRLLRYTQVRPTTLRSDEAHRMLTECVGCSLAPFLVFIGGADTVRLSDAASHVHDH